MFLGHLLPLHHLAAGPDTSILCPEVPHSNSLSPTLWASQGTGAQSSFIPAQIFQEPPSLGQTESTLLVLEVSLGLEE